MKKILAKIICMFVANKKKRKEIRQRVMDFSFISVSQSSNNPKLIMTLLVKDEVDIIEKQLKFHKKMGVDGFIVTDNISSDGTLEILKKYEEKGWVLEIIHEPAQNIDQSTWVNRMVNLAKDKYNAEWVINADADEFWFSKKFDLKHEMRSKNYNVLKCPMFNMIPPQNNSFIESTKKVVKPITDGKTYKLSEFNLFSKQVPKVLHRTHDFISIHEGNHNVDMVRRVMKDSNDISIYHYPIRSLEHFKRKMIRGGMAFEANDKVGKDVGAHWRYFYEGYKNGTLDLDQEYAKFMAYKHHATFEDKGYVIEDKSIIDFFNQFIDLKEKFKLVKETFPRIATTKETLNKIIQNKASIARYGDAEFTIMTGENENDPYQKPNQELKEKLIEILKKGSKKNFLVAIPELDSDYNNIANFKNSGVSFWQFYWTPRFDKLKYFFTQNNYFNAFISRENIFFENSLEEIKKIWENRKVVFVASNKGRFSIDKRLFDNVGSYSVISNFKPTQTYEDYDKIMKEILQHEKDSLILIATGPSATVLAYDLHQLGYQALDIGHLPNSYAQYLGEIKSPESLPMKKKRKFF